MQGYADFHLTPQPYIRDDRSLVLKCFPGDGAYEMQMICAQQVCGWKCNEGVVSETRHEV